MSDRDGIGELSLERWVSDLETVIDAAGVDRCSRLGISRGAATAIAYAVRNPDPGSRYFTYQAGPRARSTRKTCPDGASRMGESHAWGISGTYRASA
jgi:pimeloyl-ACP methyl ester carboxylesterase